MLDRYATMESLDLDETKSTRPTPSDSTNEIMDAISRRVDGKLVVRTCRATRKGKSSSEFDCPLHDTDQAGEAQTRLPGAVRAPRTASADCRRSPTRKSPRTSTRRRSTGWPHPSRSSNRPKPCTDGAHQTGRRTERNAQPARTGRAWRRAGLVVRNVLEQRYRAPRRSATRSHRAGRAPPHAAARGCPHRAERRSGARRHASGWPPSTGAHSAAPTMPVSAHTAARIDGRSGPTRRPHASTNRPGHPAVRYSGDRTEQHADPDRVHTEQDTCLNAPGARRRFGRYARTTESALPRTQTLIFRNAPHGSAFACQAPQPDRGPGRQRLRIGEHHAFPELAECPAGPPTAFRTHGDACRQERTECNGRRNLPARAECNARDNCQYAPSVPAPETGRHVVCGNVGRRPRFGSLPSSAACLPDVGERACLAIHRSTSATARAAAARISCRSSTAAATALSPSRHSIALRVFSESAIACSTRAKTVSTPAGSILGQRHRRRVWRGPVILAWRPLFASTGVTAICAGRWNRQLGMQAAAGRRTSRRPDAVAASRVRPGAAASARRAVGQAGAPTRGGKRGPVEVTPQTLAEMLGAPAEPNVEAAGRKRAAGRRRRAVPHGGGRRRGARPRGQPPARLRGAGPYRAPGRGHCGSRPHRAVVAARHRRTLRPRPGLPARHRRHLHVQLDEGPQGGRLGRRDDGRRAGLRLRAASAQYRRRGDDRRGHPRWTGAPGRRHRREGAGRAPRRVAPCPPGAAQPQAGR